MSYPIVEIKKITIDEASNFPPSTDPHAKNRSTTTRNAYGKRKNRKQADPRGGSGSGSNDTAPKNFAVLLKLSMTDFVDSDGAMTWYEDDDFVKYLSLQVVQSMDPKFTEAINTGAIKLLESEITKKGNFNRDKVTIFSLPLQNAKLGPLINRQVLINQTIRFDLPTDSPAHLAYFANVVLDVDAIAAATGADMSSRAIRDSIGAYTTETVFHNMQQSKTSTTYTGPDGVKVPGQVGIIAGKFVSATVVDDAEIVTDLQGILSDFSSPTSNLAKKYLLGITVITTSTAVDKLTDLSSEIAGWHARDEENDAGQIYLAAKEVHDKYSALVSAAPLLTPVVSTNNIITNNMAIQIISEEDINILFDPNAAIDDILGVNTTDTTLSSMLKEKQEVVYTFSDAFISRDAEGHCRFMFVMNLAELVARNSKFGKLLQNSNSEIRELLQSYTKLKSITISRHEVGDVNHPAAREIVTGVDVDGKICGALRYTSSTDRAHKIESTNGGILNSLSKIPFGGSEPQFVSEQNEIASGDILAGSISEISIFPTSLSSAASVDLRSFSVLDASVSQENSGEYGYKVTVNIEDNIADILTMKFSDLRKARKTLEAFYGESVKPCNYDNDLEGYTSWYVENLYEKFNITPAASTSLAVATAFDAIDFNDKLSSIVSSDSSALDDDPLYQAALATYAGSYQQIAPGGRPFLLPANRGLALERYAEGTSATPLELDPLYNSALSAYTHGSDGGAAIEAYSALPSPTAFSPGVKSAMTSDTSAAIDSSGTQASLAMVSQAIAGTVSSALAEAAEETGISKAPWITPVAIYAEVLNIFSNVNDSAALEMATEMTKKIDPASGTPDGILECINIFHTLESKISNVLKGDASNNNAASATTRSSAGSAGSSLSKIIRAENTFSSTFDAAIAKNNGMDYLGAKSTGVSGLQIVTSGQYFSRITDETNKYFDTLPTSTSPLSNIDSVESSYLSPAEILMPNFSIDTLASPWSPTPYVEAALTTAVTKGALTSLPSSAVTKLTPVIPKVGNVISNPAACDHEGTYTALNESSLGANIAANAFLSGMNITVSYPEEDAISTAAAPMLPTSKVLGEESKFNTANFNTIGGNSETSLQGQVIYGVDISSVANAMANGLMNQGIVTTTGTVDGALSTISSFAPDSSNTTGEFYDTSLLGNAIEGMTETEIADIPNQIKSLFGASNGPLAEIGGITGDPDITPLLQYNFFSIQRVEMLTGFELSSTSNMSLNQPTWLPLNIDGFPGNSGMILCRMSTYVNGNLGITDPGSYMLPVLSRYFLISLAPEVGGVSTFPTGDISTSFGAAVVGELAASTVNNLGSLGSNGTSKSDTTLSLSKPNVSEPTIPGIYP